MAMTKNAGRNTVSGQELAGFIERIEQLREQKQQLSDDEKQVFAEAIAKGMIAKTMRSVLKVRAAKPADLEEAQANLDMYLHALGMAHEAPLFRAVGLMNVDVTAREQVIEAFKLLVPQNGEVIVRIGAQPVRLWRDEAGEAHAEDVVDAPKPAAKAAKPSTGAAPKREVPDVDAAGAFDLGKTAYQQNQPITANPFPWDDKRRPQFDAGWRAGSGGDGMGPQN